MNKAQMALWSKQIYPFFLEAICALWPVNSSKQYDWLSVITNNPVFQSMLEINYVQTSSWPPDLPHQAVSIYAFTLETNTRLWLYDNCRFHTMKLMSEEEYPPSIDLWEQHGTVMSGIKSIDFYQTNDNKPLNPTDKVFKMYYSPYAGIKAALEAAEKGTYFCPSIQVSISIPKVTLQCNLMSGMFTN